MNRRINLISLVVHDYDEAINFYTSRLGFKLVEDTPLTENKRWVRIAPTPDANFCLLLAKAADDQQQSRVGNQTGGRVFLFLETDNFQRDYQLYKNNGIKFVREPKQEPYGVVAVFEDLYGNLWDLIQPNE
ncbi:VOC family protein [Mucilaginibacter sp. RS28]|uniref:VOC family protein n=1 Tax=Mucilaginibacter straminoryzae TaxID=2932774 RepID=A0A9X2B8F6_9SPHI|nr:VOC family protein [Mucilaginibacter straminoryzae]MCJ8209416.1 VOC family protein [Mucilaginibacter straminoryzae]